MYVGLYLLPLRHPVPGRSAARDDRAARAWPTHARRRDRRRGPPRDRGLRRGPEDARAPDGRMPSDPPRPGRRHAGDVRRPVLLAQGCADRAGTIAADTTDRRRAIGAGGQPRRAARRRLARDLGLPTPVRQRARSDHAKKPARRAGTPAASSMRSMSGAALPPRASPLAICWRRRCRASTRCHSSRSSATRRTARPQHVAEFLSPYIEAGCSAFNVIPCAADDESAIAAVSELRELLIDVPSGRVLNSAAGAAPTIPSSR